MAMSYRRETEYCAVQQATRREPERLHAFDYLVRGAWVLYALAAVVALVIALRLDLFSVWALVRFLEAPLIILAGALTARAWRRP